MVRLFDSYDEDEYFDEEDNVDEYYREMELENNRMVMKRVETCIKDKENL